ncbi:MAG: cytochrome c oxidase subunit I, partial [Deltaproteobacteria bacterium]
MTSIPGTGTEILPEHEEHDERNYLKAARGLKSWLLTLDHKRIAILYLIGISSAFLLGGIFALLVRMEHWTPGATVTESADTYNQYFTLHGAIMTFLVLVPSIPAILGNFVLPMMIGAKDVAFPRLNLLSFWLWVLGALFFVTTLHFGGIDTGWTFYTPYSTTTVTKVALAGLGAFILGFSSILTGLNFLVTIHKMRAPGMGWFKMPLFLWGLYATAIIQIVATPVIGITLLLLFVERTLGFGIFDPKLGGDPVLFQHFFWFYSHPVVYVMILPGMGIMSELVSIYSRKHIFGYKFIAWSSIAIALFGFVVWGHHMFVSTQSALMSTVFSLLTFSVSIPSAIKVFNWLATMYKGSIRLTTPMLYALMFLFLFGIGGLTGLFLGTLSTDMHLHDTYFIVAHFHYTMMGSTLIALIGGIFHWWPKMFGRLYNETWGRIGAILTFIG